MLDKHEKILKDNNWIQAILILSLFGKNMTIEELDSILTKLENGALTKEDNLNKNYKLDGGYNDFNRRYKKPNKQAQKYS